MNGEIEISVSARIITPASNLRLKEEDEETYKHGFVFERSQEILTRGHTTANLTRLYQNKSRGEKTKFKFQKEFRDVLTLLRKI